MKYLNGGKAFTLGKIGELNDEVTKLLQEHCPFTIDDTICAEIRETIRHCAIMLKAEHFRPNRKAVTDLLEKFAKSTERQIEVLEEITSTDNPAAHVLSVELETHYKSIDLCELLSDNFMLLFAIQNHIRRANLQLSGGPVPGTRTERRGTNANEAAEVYVRQFMAHYKKWGGNPAAHRKGSLAGNNRDGPFVRFMKIINSLLPEEVRLAEGSLITRIDRARYPRKKSTTKTSGKKT